MTSYLPTGTGGYFWYACDHDFNIFSLREYGSRIRERRGVLDINQKELADFLSITKETLLKIENGETDDFNKDLFNKLYVKLKCHPQYLLGRKNDVGSADERYPYDPFTFGFYISEEEITGADPKKFGERLKECRNMFKLSQKQLGELIGVSAQHICKLEDGNFKNQRKTLTVERLAILSKRFGCMPRYLLGHSDGRTVYLKDGKEVFKIGAEIKITSSPFELYERIRDNYLLDSRLLQAYLDIMDMNPRVREQAIVAIEHMIGIYKIMK